MENALIELVRNDLEQYVKGLGFSEEQLQNLLMEQYSRDTKLDRTAIERNCIPQELVSQSLKCCRASYMKNCSSDSCRGKR